jgi:hypothetical protein
MYKLAVPGACRVRELDGVLLDAEKDPEHLHPRPQASADCLEEG